MAERYGMKIVVIGGNRLIGSKLVKKLREDRHDAVAASPDSGVSTLTGEGLGEALRGASVVVVSNSPSFEDGEAEKFFATFQTRKLLAAEAAAGVGHHVAVSVVGTEGLTESGYFRAKVAQEADAATDGNTVRLAPVLIQPMAADDLASAVGRIAVGAPLNGIIEVAGPERFCLDEFIRRGRSAQNDPREVVADPHARYFGATLSGRTLVPPDDAQLGETRFEDWLRLPTREIPLLCHAGQMYA